MHMIRKGQLRSTGKLCPAQQFYSLAVASLFRLLNRIQPIENLRQNQEVRDIVWLRAHNFNRIL
jgi:hypothetical protein